MKGEHESIKVYSSNRLLYIFYGLIVWREFEQATIIPRCKVNTNDRVIKTVFPIKPPNIQTLDINILLAD